MDDPLRRRMLLGSIALAAGAASARRAFAAGDAGLDDTRRLAGLDAVDTIDWAAIGELHVEQRTQPGVRVQAEPAVLAKIVTEVRGRSLHVSLAPGRLQTEQPLRVRVALPTLAALRLRAPASARIGPLAVESLVLELDTAGDVRVERLDARRFDLQMHGAFDVQIARGRVDVQRIVLAGGGRYDAPGLESRRADVRIDGAGSAQLATRETLDARIAGSGEVAYRGDPLVRREILGAGTVTRLAS